MPAARAGHLRVTPPPTRDLHPDSLDGVEWALSVEEATGRRFAPLDPLNLPLFICADCVEQWRGPMEWDVTPR